MCVIMALVVHHAPLTLLKPNPSAVRQQLNEIRANVSGDQLVGVLLGVPELDLQCPMAQNTMRAVQYLHAILFHQGETVVLVDVLTSFRYAPAPKLGKSSPSDLVTGDGDGI